MLSPSIYVYFRSALKDIEGNYLEIGIFDGEGIRGLALDFPNKTFYAIDPFIEDGNTMHTSKVGKAEEMVSIKAKALENIKLPNIRLFMMKTEEFKVTDEELDAMGITTISIDGSHWYDDVIIDINLAMRILRKKAGLVHFDDLSIPEVSRACNEFIEKHGFKMERTGAADTAFVRVPERD